MKRNTIPRNKSNKRYRTSTQKITKHGNFPGGPVVRTWSFYRQGLGLLYFRRRNQDLASCVAQLQQNTTHKTQEKNKRIKETEHCVYGLKNIIV